MHRDKERYGQDPNIVVKSKTKFNEPKKWKDPRIIFTCSWSDWFIKAADPWRDEAWDVIRLTPQHTYQILTKRPERIADHLPDDFDSFKNVWIGVSIENQKSIDRLQYFNSFDASVKFVSFEPLLGPIVIPDKYLQLIDWAIIGGESGNDKGYYRYRPCELKWIEDLADQCKKYNIPVFIKQMGTYLSKQLKMKERHGMHIDEFPAHLQIQEYPKP